MKTFKILQNGQHYASIETTSMMTCYSALCYLFSAAVESGQLQIEEAAE